jgi:hypothetical protein
MNHFIVDNLGKPKIIKSCGLKGINQQHNQSLELHRKRRKIEQVFN